jgi:four helix bundle protein
MSAAADEHSRTPKRFDLEERTAKFGESVVCFAKSIPVNFVTQPLIPQLVRASTSIGANWCEADDAGSRKEFRYRISICKREARETKHWLRMIVAAMPDLNETARPLWQEAKELHLIFAAIHRGKKSPDDNQAAK